jgi:hypothetical protein
MLSAPEDIDQCVKYAPEVRQIFSYIFDRNIISKQQLSEKTNIKEHTIYQFLLRDTDKPKYSLTLHKLYRFLVDDLDADLVKDDAESYANLGKIYKSQKAIESYSKILFNGLIDYVGSSLELINKACLRYNGTFYVYRKSVLVKRIVKTRLEIFPDETISMMWRFKQFYKDSLENTRISSGIISVNAGNVYCMGKTDNGHGLDILVLREPVQDQPVSQALVLTLDTSSQPVIAKAVVKYSKDNKEEELGAFEYDDIKSEIDNFTRFLGEGTTATSLDVV